MKYEHNIQVDRIDNISVGANNNIIGIEACLLHRDFCDYDIAVLEFVINDYKLADSERIDTWRAGYEGLVRHLAGRVPDIRVINLILAQNNPATEKRLLRLKSEISAISAHYKDRRYVYNLDFDAFIRRRTRGDSRQLERHYLDRAHYARPRTTGLIASYLARSIARARQTLAPDMELPESLHRISFDRVGMIHIPDIAPAGALEFRNARFHRTASPIPAGESFEFVSPGPLISISFLATRDAGVMMVEEEGEESAAFFTCHAHALGAPNRFVIKNHVFGIRQWTHRGPRKIRISSLGRPPSDGQASVFHQGFNMLPSLEPNTTLYVCNALYYASAP